jgi:hypothetical protein
VDAEKARTLMKGALQLPRPIPVLIAADAA